MSNFFGIRRCAKCDLLKPVEQFPVRKGRPSPHPECLSCHNIRWHENGERNRAVARGRYRRDPERHKAVSEAARQRRLPLDLARKRAYGRAHRKEAVEAVKRYCSKPHGKANRRLNGHRRRAREAEAFVEDVDIEHLLAMQDWVCHICEQHIAVGDESLDHVIPLAKGGKHAESNCLAAHRNCNSRKMTRLGYDWRHPLLIGFPSLLYPEPSMPVT